MNDVVIVAILSLAGTLIGTFGGIITANKLVSYRLEQLEKKVNLHNQVIERTYKLEGRVTELMHDVRDLKSCKK